MSTVSLLCMTCADRLTVSDDDVDYAAARVERWAQEAGWLRVEREIDGRKHTADVCETCAAIIHHMVVANALPPPSGDARVAELEAKLASETESYQRVIRHEYGKREALDARVAELEAALRLIVDDARDEERDDMRDSVDEQFIEEARAILEGRTPRRLQGATSADEGGGNDG